MLYILKLKHKLILITFICVLPVAVAVGFMFYQQQERVIHRGISAALDSTLQAISADFRQTLELRIRDVQQLSSLTSLLEQGHRADFRGHVAKEAERLDIFVNPSNIFLLDTDFNSISSKGQSDEELAERFYDSLSPYIQGHLLRKANKQKAVNALPSGIFQHDSNYYISVWSAVEENEDVGAWLVVVYPFSQNISHMLANSIRQTALREYGEVSVVIEHDKHFVSGYSVTRHAAKIHKTLQRSSLVAWRGLAFDVSVTLDKSKFDSSIQSQRVDVVVTIALLMVLQVCILAWAIRFFLLARIKSLNVAASAFAAGDFSVRLPRGGDDELGELSDVFNAMCAEISQAHLYLRKMVDVRTAQAEESAARLQAILESVGDAIVSVSASGEILSFNEAAECIFGYLQEEILGKSVDILMPYSFSIEHDKAIKNASEKSQFSKRELGRNRRIFGKRSNGEQFPIWVTVTRSGFDEDLSFTGVIRDLSEMEEAERKIVEKERILNAAIHASYQPFLIVSAEENILELNDALCTWLGFARDELMLMQVGSFASEKYREAITRAFEKLRLGELRTLSQEMQFTNKAGHLVWGLLTMSAVYDGDGALTCFVIQVTDIHDSKSLALELEDRNRELEKSNADLDQFAYVASHDLKSPLNAIRKVISWIEEDEELSDSMKQNIEIIKSRSERMLNLLNDLLSYARIGQLEGGVETVNIRELAIRVFDILDKPESFSLHVDDNYIDVPRVPFELVMRNVMSNAIKHHDKACGSIRVTLGRDRMNLIVRVTDDGPGIAKAMQGKVFEMFQTLRPRDQIEGSGMGLALVKRTAEFFGGSIGLESDGESGTTVIIRWPLSITHKTEDGNENINS